MQDKLSNRYPRGRFTSCPSHQDFLYHKPPRTVSNSSPVDTSIETSKPFNKTNIDILNYVQRTRQRIVDVPIIDNGGETSPVYVRDVWVDYADGIIRRFILSEGAVCIDPPVPRAYPQPRPQDLFDMITDATNEIASSYPRGRFTSCPSHQDFLYHKPPRTTSKPFNKTNIDILNYVQRTRQRIVDVPIIDNGGETSPVYVRRAVCIDPPVPRAYPQPRPQDLFDMITDATNENCFIVFPIYPPRYEGDRQTAFVVDSLRNWSVNADCLFRRDESMNYPSAAMNLNVFYPIHLVRWDLNLKLSMAIDCIGNQPNATFVQINYPNRYPRGRFTSCPSHQDFLYHKPPRTHWFRTSPDQTPVQRKIEVLSNVTFKELKEEIHKAINTIPREEI
ncbi:hypothetical protein BLNAU_21181 [Blattamonas nauphoetae]|uniref:Uncharacterized protein n=1 Tax=Blattamonas nauphoetae TaxID=2049346 RepID=A0ABQ9WWN4_9EUKA|nr:hypothetical protein BLNAU_21181 [Blattamonas nauphoetae]